MIHSICSNDESFIIHVLHEIYNENNFDKTFLIDELEDINQFISISFNSILHFPENIRRIWKNQQFDPKRKILIFVSLNDSDFFKDKLFKLILHNASYFNIPFVFWIHTLKYMNSFILSQLDTIYIDANENRRIIQRYLFSDVDIQLKNLIHPIKVWRKKCSMNTCSNWYEIMIF